MLAAPFPFPFPPRMSVQQMRCAMTSSVLRCLSVGQLYKYISAIYHRTSKVASSIEVAQYGNSHILLCLPMCIPLFSRLRSPVHTPKSSNPQPQRPNCHRDWCEQWPGTLDCCCLGKTRRNSLSGVSKPRPRRRSSRACVITSRRDKPRARILLDR